MNENVHIDDIIEGHVTSKHVLNTRFKPYTLLKHLQISKIFEKQSKLPDIFRIPDETSFQNIVRILELLTKALADPGKSPHRV